jgi:hypothetical protein
MEKNILKEVNRNALNYMKQFNQTVIDSLKKIKERKGDK